MGIIGRALRLRFPRGPIWRFVGDGDWLLEGIATSLERIKLAIDNARSESIPSTATETLPEWHHALGIAYDPTLPVDKQRAMLDAILTASGNSTRDGLAHQIAKEYPSLSIIETDAIGYSVTGQVPTVQDARRVGAIVAHYAPLHLVPTIFGYTASVGGNDNAVPVTPSVDDPSIISVNRSCRCGIGTCGLMRLGRSA